VALIGTTGDQHRWVSVYFLGGTEEDYKNQMFRWLIQYNSRILMVHHPVQAASHWTHLTVTTSNQPVQVLVCFAGIKEAETVLDVVVPRHCEGEEEDVVFIQL
jgi:hypothetical protein